MDMPLEVLSLSLCRLEKSDLMSVRLVSKAFERAAVPFLFDEVYFSTNRVDIELAQLIISHFNAYIKMIVFSLFCWHEMDRHEFKRQISYQAKSKFDLKNKLLAKHLTVGWDDYADCEKNSRKCSRGLELLTSVLLCAPSPAFEDLWFQGLRLRTLLVKTGSRDEPDTRTWRQYVHSKIAKNRILSISITKSALGRVSASTVKLPIHGL